MTTTAGGDSPYRDSFTTGHDGTRLYVREQRVPTAALTGAVGVPGVSESGSLPVALFSDGILCDGFIWKYLWASVGQRLPMAHWHYRGHGRSAPPVDPDAIDIATHADDLGQVRRHLGDPPVVLFGHSMGCQVALEAYRQRPEGVRGLVLLCGSYGRITETFRNTRVLSQVLPRIIERVAANPLLARALWSRIPHDVAVRFVLLTRDIDPATVRPEDVKPYMEHMTHVDLPMFLRMLQAAGEHSAFDVLPTITCPVLIVAGEKDTFTPAHLSEQMKAAIPNAELVMVAGGTHVAPLEQRELVSGAVDRFLTTHFGG